MSRSNDEFGDVVGVAKLFLPFACGAQARDANSSDSHEHEAGILDRSSGVTRHILVWQV